MKFGATPRQRLSITVTAGTLTTITNERSLCCRLTVAIWPHDKARPGGLCAHFARISWFVLSADATCSLDANHCPLFRVFLFFVFCGGEDVFINAPHSNSLSAHRMCPHGNELICFIRKQKLETASALPSRLVLCMAHLHAPDMLKLNKREDVTEQSQNRCLCCVQCEFTDTENNQWRAMETDVEQQHMQHCLTRVDAPVLSNTPFVQSISMLHITFHGLGFLLTSDHW